MKPFSLPNDNFTLLNAELYDKSQNAHRYINRLKLAPHRSEIKQAIGLQALWFWDILHHPVFILKHDDGTLIQILCL
jgi:hypothetical protein